MKRLYKSRRDRIIDGVCGGIGEYLGVDPTIVRIIFLLLFFMGGVGLILYIAGMLIIPVNPEHKEAAEVKAKKRPLRGRGVLFVIGLLLVFIGFGLLLENFGWPVWHFLKVSFNFILPLAIIAIGVFFILSYFSKREKVGEPESEAEQAKTEEEPMKRLFRSKKNRMIFGVCGGLGEYLNTDPTVVRILWVILAISSLGIAVLLYLIMAIIVPEEPTV
jgi:phage shock protein C